MTSERDKQRKREWYLKNKERMNERTKQWFKDHPNWKKEYYEKNKDKIYQQQKEYTKRNRKKITNMVVRRRKEVATELKNKGQMYCYLPKTERQNKMIEHLCKRTDMSKEESRALLVAYDWNIKQIKAELVIENLKGGETNERD